MPTTASATHSSKLSVISLHYALIPCFGAQPQTQAVCFTSCEQAFLSSHHDELGAKSDRDCNRKACPASFCSLAAESMSVCIPFLPNSDCNIALELYRVNELV